MQEHNLSGRVILITGGASGIGRAAARRLAAIGADVVIADRDRAPGEALVEEIEMRGGHAMFEQVDVAIEDSVADLFDRILARKGALDGAFNNAGIEQAHKPLHKLSEAEWNRVISVNLTGMFFCLKREIRVMLDRGRGAIVNTASVLGEVAVPNSAEYVAAKHGVLGLTRSAALETAARGIRVNAIMPGVIRTPMIERFEANTAARVDMAAISAAHPIGRLGTAEEIAAVATWLLSDDSSFVTGAAIAADGGYLAV